MFNPTKDKNIFLLVSFIFWFSHFIYIPTLSPYMESLGGKYTFIGIVLSSYGLMQFLLRLPIGIFSDVIKLRKPFIIIGMLISTISCLIYSVTDSLIWILIARCFAGVAAATWVVFTVLYASYFVNQEVHRAMSSISFIIVLAQSLGMALSGYIVNEWGWHVPFWIGLGFGVFGTIMSFFIFEPKEGIVREPVKMKDLISVFQEPQLLKTSLLSILAHSIIFTTMFGFIPTYALKIGFQSNDLSLVIFSFMIPHAFATLFMSKVFVSFFGKWRTLEILFFLTSFFTLATPLVTSKSWLCIFQSINGFALGIIFPLLLGMSIESIPHKKKATAMGLYQALYALGIFAGPFFAGMLNSQMGIAAGFYFVAALGLIATIFITNWRRKDSVQVGLEINQ
ncbi:MFS transporter [Bacillus sp. FJAT-29790]|uniref:MFS transporter n=1 Tax=Bacillus sp. FJAT-29790 TaxID=1895002 RepID=UPI001C234406|nr:MFS transporter [Bacillus sp. FJAT-29790]MBU8879266.1 MFS transporter [Bacillus sp. FJAT-29790]